MRIDPMFGCNSLMQERDMQIAYKQKVKAQDNEKQIWDAFQKSQWQKQEEAENIKEFHARQKRQELAKWYKSEAERKKTQKWEERKTEKELLQGLCKEIEMEKAVQEAEAAESKLRQVVATRHTLEENIKAKKVVYLDSYFSNFASKWNVTDKTPLTD
jgi:thioesterase domain-containing protein